MKAFKTESKKILDMMINSIYTNRDIFLRELISNASDAIDKAHFDALTNSDRQREYMIKVDIDKNARTLTITDNGIGMDALELEKNLGTIAKSGTEEFKKELGEKSDLEVIGQFGVGFYSAFMVADFVEVYSKTFDGKASKWQSHGASGYDIEELDGGEVGTKIVLHIKTNSEDFNYDKYLEEYEIRNLIKKYSDYIRYPIEMSKIVNSKNDAGDEVTENVYETVNSMVPLWKRNKADIKEEEYNDFYKNNFYDYENPLHIIHYSVEGKVSFKALLYFPSKVDYNFYTKDYEKGLKLFTNGVLITDKYAELLPDYFSFVKGVVDAELPLNVSRETLQHSKDVQVIALNIENKIKTELENILKNDREKYEKFYEQFGLQLKYTIYKEFGLNKEKLQDLLMFYSTKEGKNITFKEYVEKSKEGESKIYYIPAKNKDIVKTMPMVDEVLEKGNDVLVLTDNIDELVLKMIVKYADKQFANVMNESGEKEELTLTDEDKNVETFAKGILGDKVEAVKLTQKLKDHPVGLLADGEISLDMEKSFVGTPNENSVKAKKILQINMQSSVFEKLKKSIIDNKDYAEKLVKVLYEQARLSAGLELEDATNYTKLVCELI